jgi:transposase
MTPMIPLFSTPPSLCLGIDIGKTHHVVGFVSAEFLARYGDFDHCPTVQLPMSRAPIEALLSDIEQHLCPLSACAVLMEVTGHYHRTLAELLLERGLEVYLISVHNRKDHLDKSDRIDALRLANLLYSQRVLGAQVADPLHRIRQLYPPAETAAQLQPLVRRHHELVVDLTRRRNKLTAIADELFPELTQVLRDPNAPNALRLRERFPTPEAIASASLDDLRSVRTHSRPGDDQLLRLRELAASSLGTRDPARKTGLILEQRQLIDELRLLSTHLAAISAQVESLASASREGQILLSLGVIGPVQAGYILSAIGNIANFASRSRFKKFCGWAPQIAQTGAAPGTVQLTRGGSRLLKHTLYFIALRAIKEDTEWRRLYERLVPLKCPYDARTGRYLGKRRVIGRICGDLAERIYLLLARDQRLLAHLPAGTAPPPPVLYDRAGQRHAPPPQD